MTNWGDGELKSFPLVIRAFILRNSAPAATPLDLDNPHPRRYILTSFA